MQLVIAEKPSVARNIAKVLHATNVKDGYLEGKEYLVSWCIGHLIELASADQYRDDWKAWKYETLPMIPENWKYQIKESTKGQFRVLKELLHRADITEVICATDGVLHTIRIYCISLSACFVTNIFVAVISTLSHNCIKRMKLAI